MPGRMRLAWGAVGRTWGVWVAPVATAIAFSALWAVTSVGLALDPLLFPRLRRIRATRPIVVVGNPRTGTTFLQRFLVEQRFGAGLQLWRMLYPSLTAQVLIRPFVPLLERISPARHHTTVAHDTNLMAVETDDVSTMFRYFDGFFLYGFLLAWADEEHRALFEPEHRDTSARDFAWYDELWRRAMVWHGTDRVVAKLFSLGARLPAFLAHHPDARVLYTVRDPVQALPSALSLVSGVLDKRFGFWSLPEPVRRRWIERVYTALIDLMRRFHDDWTAGRIPRDRVLIVRFDRMMQDFEGQMADIADFVGHTPDAQVKAEIVRVAENQRRFQSPHGYDASRFGLDEERIRRDCAFWYQAFLGSDPD